MSDDKERYDGPLFPLEHPGRRSTIGSTKQTMRKDELRDTLKNMLWNDMPDEAIDDLEHQDD